MKALGYIAGYFLGWGIRAVDHLARLCAARTELPGDFDDHAEQAMAILAGSDLIDAQVPQGTGERMAREIETWLRKENAA